VTFSDPKEAFLFIFTRVARWYIFRPIISIWVNFGVIAMKDVGKFYGHLVYFVVILVYCSHFDVLYQEKSGNSDLHSALYQHLYLFTL
jgi:hypothetical protein